MKANASKKSPPIWQKAWNTTNDRDPWGREEKKKLKATLIEKAAGDELKQTIIIAKNQKAKTAQIHSSKEHKQA